MRSALFLINVDVDINPFFFSNLSRVGVQKESHAYAPNSNLNENRGGEWGCKKGSD